MISLLPTMMLTLSISMFAAGGKTSEMPGTIVAATGTTLVVEKGGEKYEFAIDPAMIKGFHRTQSRLDRDRYVSDERNENRSGGGTGFGDHAVKQTHRINVTSYPPYPT